MGWLWKHAGEGKASWSNRLAERQTNLCTRGETGFFLPKAGACCALNDLHPKSEIIWISGDLMFAWKPGGTSKIMQTFGRSQPTLMSFTAWSKRHWAFGFPGRNGEANLTRLAFIFEAAMVVNQTYFRHGTYSAAQPQPQTTWALCVDEPAVVLVLAATTCTLVRTGGLQTADTAFVLSVTVRHGSRLCSS